MKNTNQRQPPASEWLRVSVRLQIVHSTNDALEMVCVCVPLGVGRRPVKNSATKAQTRLDDLDFCKVGAPLKFDDNIRFRTYVDAGAAGRYRVFDI